MYKRYEYITLHFYSCDSCDDKGITYDYIETTKTVNVYTNCEEILKIIETHD